MGLETVTYIDDLNVSNPIPGDARSQGDDHLRNIKTALKNTLPNGTRPWYFPRAATKTADFVIAATDLEKLFLCNCTADHIDVTLPALTASNDGWACRFVKTDATANTIRIAGTINGDADGFTVSRQYQMMILLWTGTEWIAFHSLYFTDNVATLAALTVSDLLSLSSTERMVLPGGTTAQRPGVPAEKDARLNSTLTALEFYLNGAWNVVQADKIPRGYVSGGIQSNGADVTNDINFTAGVCRDYTDTVTMTLQENTSGKQVDANWVAAATTNSGARHSDAGLAVEGTYGIYAARTAASPLATYYFYPLTDGTDWDSDAQHAIVLAELQGETGGASYAYIKRIGAFIRAGNANILFTQHHNKYYRTPVKSHSAVSITNAGVDLTLDVPAGLKVEAIFNGYINNLSGGEMINFYPKAIADMTVTASDGPGSISMATDVSANHSSAISERPILTDTSRRIRAKNSAAAASADVWTVAWIDALR